MNSLMDGGIPDNPCWIRGEDGILHYEEQIFVSDTGNLWLQLLKTKHDYVLAGHPGQSKTYQLVH